MTRHSVFKIGPHLAKQTTLNTFKVKGRFILHSPRIIQLHLLYNFPKVINGILESLPQNLIPFFSSWFLDSEVFNAFYEIKVILHHQGWFSFGILLLRPLSFHSMKWLHRVSNFNFKSNFEWDFKSNRPDQPVSVPNTFFNFFASPSAQLSIKKPGSEIDNLKVACQKLII